MKRFGEFDYIKRRLAPLSASCPGADALRDDGAVLAIREGCELVLTADTLVEGRHFFSDDDPALVARKALRVSLSDLAAMGADPLGYMTSIVWPLHNVEPKAERFADGLVEDQNVFDLPLLGGDTTASKGPWTISVTALGEVPEAKAVRRSGAQAGDMIIVTGTIGDAWLGLQARQNLYAPKNDAHAGWIENRLMLPMPRLALNALVREHANAAIDISDGLLADLKHIADASDLHLSVELQKLPCSDAAKAYVRSQTNIAEAFLNLATGGDDYELALTVPSDKCVPFQTEAHALGVRTTIIGKVDSGPAVFDIRHENEKLAVDHLGFTHF